MANVGRVADVAKRRVAANQLRQLIGDPLDFDPEADDATRSRQIERLHERCRKTAAEYEPEPAAE